MDYIDALNAAQAGDPYEDKDPAQGKAGSAIPAQFFNDIQTEILDVITTAGVTPDAGDLTQLTEAILSLITANQTTVVDATETVKGIVEKATIVEFKAGAAEKYPDAATILSALGFSKHFASGEQTITSAGGLTIAHGLGNAPQFIQAELVCKTAEYGYSVGDVVYYSAFGGQGDTGSGDVDRGFAIHADSANIGVRFGNQSANNTIRILNKTTGALAYLTDANWNLILKAWA